MRPGSSIRSPRSRENSIREVRAAISAGSRSERDADRDRAEGVAEVVRLGERELEIGLARPASRSAPTSARPRPSAREREDVAAGTEREAPRASRADAGSSASSSAGITARPSAAEPMQDLGLGLDDRVEGPEQLEVHGPDVRDRGHVGLGDVAELGDLAHPPHRHLHDEQSRSRAAPPSIASGMPISVLKFSGLAWTRPRQDRPADVLDRGLAGRAGDADQRAAELAPPAARQRLQREQRIGRRRRPGRREAGGDRARQRDRV